MVSMVLLFVASRLRSGKLLFVEPADSLLNGLSSSHRRWTWPFCPLLINAVWVSLRNPVLAGNIKPKLKKVVF